MVDHMEKDLSRHYQDNLVYLLLNTSRHLRQRLRAEMASQEAAASVPLELISQVDFNGTRIVDLARRLNCSKQAASKQVQEAERRGLLRLQPDPDDKRAKKVYFAEGGLALLQQGQATYQALEQQLASGMGATELAQLKQALQQLRRSLRESGRD